MIEVEAKIGISKPDELRRVVRLLGKYKGREEKIDDYYTLEGGGKYPHKSLRIRHYPDKLIVNFKKSISWENGIHAKKEVEFPIKIESDFLSFIEDFGFRKWLRKEKTTELYEIEPNFHIELNYVRRLGWFLEIECLSDMKGINGARNKILSVVEQLGFTKKDLIKEGYTKMLWDKHKI